jgi:NADH-quinone oxidoreductase subunit L
VWLPDAMEGPTPVSALIHAATMVAAGVYLIARTYPLFQAVPQALFIVAIIGGFTAIFAASMGLASNDIKRVLAFSTVSQLGYMMLALGAGSLDAGMFHLFTHAFFKALLFLCAGSVIHAVGTNDITEMGGLRKFMPITYWTMLVGSLSLVGFPLFSGFWSKDEVLAADADAGQTILLTLAVITVFLTGFYTFRMFFLTFHGSYRGQAAAAAEESHTEHHDTETHTGGPHEADGWMTIPLIILAIPAALIGLWGSPLLNYGFERFLEGASYQTIVPNYLLATISSVLGIAGIAAAWVWYGARAYQTEPLLRFGAAYRVLSHRYYIDELYMWLIDKLAIGVAFALSAFDRGALDQVGNELALAIEGGGSVLRRIQTGRVQNYGLVLFGGMAVIALVVLFVPAVRP